MDFTENEDHRAIRQAVRDVCKQFDDDYWMRLEAEHEFPWDFYREMAKGGWIGIAIPEEYGGGGQGIAEASIVLEEVAASGACMNGCSAIHLSIFGMHRWSCTATSRSDSATCPGSRPATCTWRSA